MCPFLGQERIGLTVAPREHAVEKQFSKQKWDAVAEMKGNVFGAEQNQNQTPNPVSAHYRV